MYAGRLLGQRQFGRSSPPGLVLEYMLFENHQFKQSQRLHSKKSRLIQGGLKVIIDSKPRFGEPKPASPLMMLLSLTLIEVSSWARSLMLPLRIGERSISSLNFALTIGAYFHNVAKLLESWLPKLEDSWGRSNRRETKS